MTNEEKQIEIAEACGWTQVHFRTQRSPITADTYSCWLGKHPEKEMYKHNGGFGCVPDYLTDLNAMHGAEEVLNGEVWAKYFDLIQRDGMATGVRATAAQRADTFLKALGKWK